MVSVSWCQSSPELLVDSVGSYASMGLDRAVLVTSPECHTEGSSGLWTSKREE